MFERYTEAARRVIFYSRYMANQAGYPEIETEHVLLGLLRADMALARRFLGSPWAAEEVWRDIERRKPVITPTQGTADLPLSKESKRVLFFAAEEADKTPSQNICTQHLLLGLLGLEDCLGAVLLNAYGLRLARVREDLTRNPHNDAIREDFVRERPPLPQDIVEAQNRIKAIAKRLEQAVADHDFAKARSCSEEERLERANLRALYHNHGLMGWIFD